ncbi:hypothetical protein BVRB_1g000060 [Beta vulgaris subsp. vulgaris]|nr:hypothetical protein BVRB_1g000060 [Beta vulgaris subsp. vulgaris]
MERNPLRESLGKSDVGIALFSLIKSNENRVRIV